VTVRDEFALQVFYLSLALIIMGVGFLKPNISTIVGRLYPENDPRRDSGFTLFAAGINVGAMFASLICAYLGETFGWKYGFGAAGIGMLAGLIMFLWGQKYLMGHAEPAFPEKLRERVGPVSRETAIYLGGALGVVVVWQLIQRTWTVHGAMHIIALGFLAWFAWFLVRHCDRVQRAQMLSLVVLIVGVLMFYALYEQTYGSWITYTDRLSTKDFFGATGTHSGLPWAVYSLVLSPPLMIAALRASDRGNTGLAVAIVGLLAAGVLIAIGHDVVLVPQTAGSLTFLGAFFLVVLAPLFSWLWPFLDRRGLNPSKPAKMALALIASGLSFWPLAVGAGLAADGQLVSVWWLVLAYLILEIGEICLLPIGMSAVTQLSVARVVGLMMGAFWLATAYAEVLAAQFSKLASLDIPEGASVDFAEASAKYGDLFGQMIWIGVGTGVVALLLVPFIRRGMHGVK
jgi:POT family proton-dependent oligopeptide transporter